MRKTYHVSLTRPSLAGTRQSASCDERAAYDITWTGLWRYTAYKRNSNPKGLQAKLLVIVTSEKELVTSGLAMQLPQAKLHWEVAIRLYLCNITSLTTKGLSICYTFSPYSGSYTFSPVLAVIAVPTGDFNVSRRPNEIGRASCRERVCQYV